MSKLSDMSGEGPSDAVEAVRGAQIEGADATDEHVELSAQLQAAVEAGDAAAAVDAIRASAQWSGDDGLLCHCAASGRHAVAAALLDVVDVDEVVARSKREDRAFAPLLHLALRHPATVGDTQVELSPSLAMRVLAVLQRIDRAAAADDAAEDASGLSGSKSSRKLRDVGHAIGTMKTPTLAPAPDAPLPSAAEGPAGFADATDANGRSALHAAVEGGHVDVVRALVALSDVPRGVDVNRVDSSGTTPLALALDDAHRSGTGAMIGGLLVAGGADAGLLRRSKTLAAAAYVAACSPADAVVTRALARQGASAAGLIDGSGRSAIEVLLRGEAESTAARGDVARWLLKAHADPVAPLSGESGRRGANTLHLAAALNQAPVIDAIAKKLHGSALRGFIERATASPYAFSAESRESGNFPDGIGPKMTPMAVALSHGHTESVNSLRNAGAAMPKDGILDVPKLAVAALADKPELASSEPHLLIVGCLHLDTGLVQECLRAFLSDVDAHAPDTTPAWAALLGRGALRNEEDEDARVAIADMLIDLVPGEDLRSITLSYLMVTKDAVRMAKRALARLTHRPVWRSPLSERAGRAGAPLMVCAARAPKPTRLVEHLLGAGVDPNGAEDGTMLRAVHVLATLPVVGGYRRRSLSANPDFVHPTDDADEDGGSDGRAHPGLLALLEAGASAAPIATVEQMLPPPVAVAASDAGDEESKGHEDAAPRTKWAVPTVLSPEELDRGDPVALAVGAGWECLGNAVAMLEANARIRVDTLAAALDLTSTRGPLSVAERLLRKRLLAAGPSRLIGSIADASSTARWQLVISAAVAGPAALMKTLKQIEPEALREMKDPRTDCPLLLRLLQIPGVAKPQILEVLFDAMVDVSAVHVPTDAACDSDDSFSGGALHALVRLTLCSNKPSIEEFANVLRQLVDRGASAAVRDADGRSAAQAFLARPAVCYEAEGRGFAAWGENANSVHLFKTLRGLRGLMDADIRSVIPEPGVTLDEAEATAGRHRMAEAIAAAGLQPRYPLLRALGAYEQPYDTPHADEQYPRLPETALMMIKAAGAEFEDHEGHDLLEAIIASPSAAAATAQVPSWRGIVTEIIEASGDPFEGRASLGGLSPWEVCFERAVATTAPDRMFHVMWCARFLGDAGARSNSSDPEESLSGRVRVNQALKCFTEGTPLECEVFASVIAEARLVRTSVTYALRGEFNIRPEPLLYRCSSRGDRRLVHTLLRDCPADAVHAAMLPIVKAGRPEELCVNDGDGRSPVDIALRRESHRAAVAMALIATGGEQVMTRLSHDAQYQMLRLAVEQQELELTVQLLEHGANPNLKSESFFEIFRHALQEVPSTPVSMASADMDCDDLEGAVSMSHRAALRSAHCLVRNGALFDERDATVIQVLLSSGTFRHDLLTPSVTGSAAGRNILHVAADNNNSAEIIRILARFLEKKHIEWRQHGTSGAAVAGFTTSSPASPVAQWPSVAHLLSERDANYALPIDLARSGRVFEALAEVYGKYGVRIDGDIVVVMSTAGPKNGSLKKARVSPDPGSVVATSPPETALSSANADGDTKEVPDNAAPIDGGSSARDDGDTSDNDFDYEALPHWERAKVDVELRRQSVLSRLRRAHLLTRRVDTARGDKFIVLTAPLGRLQWEAQRLRLKLPLRSQSGGETARREREARSISMSGLDDSFIAPARIFTVDKRNDFEPFEKSLRAMLVLSILDYDAAMGPDVAGLEILAEPQQPWDPDDMTRGAGLNLPLLLQDGVVHSVFPLHSAEEQVYVRAMWLRNGSLQPISSLKDLMSEDRKNALPSINALREYFGERLAMWLAWGSHYTAMLAMLIPLAVVVTLVQVVDRIDGICLPVAAVVVVAWASAALQLFKRKASELAHRWRTLDEPVPDSPRQEFLFLTLPFRRQRHPVTQVNEPVPPSPMLLCLLSAPLPLALIALVVASNIWVLSVRAEGSSAATSGASRFGWKVLGGFGCGVLTVVFGAIHQPLAARLTAWEDHRTLRGHNTALVLRSSVFAIVNHYFSLMWLGFFLDRGTDDASAATDVATHLLFMMLTATLTSLVKQQLSSTRSRKRRNDESYSYRGLNGSRDSIDEHSGGDEASAAREVSEVLQQAALPAANDRVEEHVELVSQWGFIVLFAATMPSLCVLAVLHNLVALRHEVSKLLDDFRRAARQRARDLGTWTTVLDAIVWLSVITNGLIVTYASDSLPQYYVSADAAVGWSWGDRAVAFIVVEHALVAVRLFVVWLLPGRPQWVVDDVHAEVYAAQRARAELTD